MKQDYVKTDTGERVTGREEDSRGLRNVCAILHDDDDDDDEGSLSNLL